MKVMTTLSRKVTNNFIDDSNMSEFLTNQIYWWSSFSSRRSSLFNKLKLIQSYSIWSLLLKPCHYNKISLLTYNVFSPLTKDNYICMYINLLFHKKNISLLWVIITTKSSHVLVLKFFYITNCNVNDRYCCTELTTHSHLSANSVSYTQLQVTPYRCTYL